MKKKDVSEIIGRLTDLEVKIARYHVLVENPRKPDILEWFTELNKITSDLDKIYKNEKKKVAI